MGRMSDLDILIGDAHAAATWRYDCSANVLAGVDCAVILSCRPEPPVFRVEFRPPAVHFARHLGPSPLRAAFRAVIESRAVTRFTDAVLARLSGRDDVKPSEVTA